MTAIPNGVMVGHIGTNANVPAGWARATAYDSRYVKMVATSATNPGGTGGAANHLHTIGAHTHTGHSHGHGGGGTSGTPVGNSRATQAGNTFAENVHTHAYTFSAATADTSGAVSGVTNWDTQTNDADFIVVIFIKSDGTPTGFPASCLAWAAAAAPTGWNQYTAGSYVWKGAATGGDSNAVTGGGSSSIHTHTSQNHTHANGAGHTHPVSLSSAGQSSDNNSLGVGFSLTSNAHSHTGTTGSVAAPYSGTAAPTSTAGDVRPPSKQLLMIQNVSGGAAYTKTVIAMWDGTIAAIPAGYYLCDGTNGTPDVRDKFVAGAINVGAINGLFGAATHTHAAGGSHTHSIGNHQHAGGTSSSDNGGGIAQAGADGIDFHTHTFGATATDGSGTSGASTLDAAANASNLPTYTDIAYIMFVNKAPDAPTINVPLPATAYSSLITLDATVTDPDGDAVFAEFQYDRSDNAWTTIGNGTTVATGGHSTRSWDISALQAGFVYRVRARGNDGATLNNVGPYTTSATFIIGPGFAGLFADIDDDSPHVNANGVIVAIDPTHHGLYRTTVTARGPLVYWRMKDYANGAALVDHSGNALDGLFGPSGMSTPGPADDGVAGAQAAIFGPLTLATRTHHALFNLAAPFTLEFWVRLNAYHDDYAVQPLRKWSTTLDANFVVYMFGTDAGGLGPHSGGSAGTLALYATAGGGAGLWQNITPLTPQLSLRAWHMIDFTYEVAGGGRAYVDAVEVTPAVAYAGALQTNAQPVGIEVDGSAMAEVAIYHTAALTPAQILANFAAAQRSRRYEAIPA